MQKLSDRIIPKQKNKMQQTLEENLTRIQKNKEAFAIWGAGATGQGILSFIREFSQGRLEPEYVIDNNSSLWGTGNIISPKQFCECMKDIANVFVCVYVADQVVAQLKEYGYQGKIIPASMSVLGCEDRVLLYEENMEKVEEVYELFADEQSRDTIAAFMNVGRSGDTSYWDKVNGPSEEKLLDTGVLSYGKKEHFIDVGAFTGDTIEKFIQLCGGNYASILGIEADQRNFSVLQEKCNLLTNVNALNAAVCECSGVKHFCDGNSESSYLCEGGTTEVKAVKIDDLKEAEEVSLIKISTNGFEMDVLKGAAKTIKSKKPKLSYYCSREELWRIPLFLKSLVPEYKFYVRHYGIGMQALIGYAVIEE